MSDLTFTARLFATKAHGEQKRKYTGEPYINHPQAVALLVKSVPHTDEMVAAAWLHDVVEDTGTPLADIEEVFGKEVAALVEQVTDVSRPTDGNHKTRKEMDREHLASASAAAQTIKIADLIDNSKSIMQHDPEFAAVYLQEKRALLEVLTEGDATLFAMAKKIVDEAKP